MQAKPLPAPAPDHAPRAAAAWNSVAGILVALQSVVVLVVVSHVCGPADAGVYTIAYTTANLFLYLGNYGMRQFQASDRYEQYAFPDYAFSRVITCLLMIGASGAYILWAATAGGYVPKKLLAVISVCLFKLVDAAEDIFHGEYQRKGRLDVAAKLLSFRMFTSLLLLCVIVVATGDMLPGLVMSTVYTAGFLAFEVAYVRVRYRIPSHGKVSLSKAVELLKTCFPLFFAAFLLFYVGNAPRWAIDSLLGDVQQAVFGYIMMPNFVITLLASFVYNPMITSLADSWLGGDVRGFGKKITIVALFVIAIAAACAVVALFAGAPLLGAIFAVKLDGYANEIAILVVAGGFLGLLSLATLGITISRKQRMLIPTYSITAVIAFVFSPLVVGEWGICGACWMYFVAMVSLAVVAGFYLGRVVLRAGAQQH